MTRYLFYFLSFLAIGGIDIWLTYILPIDFLFKKHKFLLALLLIILSLLFSLIYRFNKISIKDCIYILSLSLGFTFLVGMDLLLHGDVNKVFVVHVFIILMLSLVMSFYQRKYKYNVFDIILKVTSITATAIILKLVIIHGSDIVAMLRLSSIKALSDLSFVNSFGYSCAFAILCTFLSVTETDKVISDLCIKEKILYYAVWIIFPIIYLILSKSKGAIGVAFLGIAFIILRYRQMIILSVIAAVSIIIIPNILKSFVIKFMMFGRTAAKEDMPEKVISMITNRFGASQVIQNPIQFFLEHPLGIGTNETLQSTYYIVDRDLIIHNHSLLVILTEAYGMFTVIGVIITFLYIALKPTKIRILSLLMMAPPLIFVNEPNFAIAIPLMLLSSNLQFETNQYNMNSALTFHDK